MRLWPKSLKWRTILLTLLGLIAVGVSAWWTIRTEIGAFVTRQQTLDDLRKSPLALDRAVSSGELRVGMTVEEWVVSHPPKLRIRHDEYDTLTYQYTVRHGSLTVVAMDGRIVFADTEFDGTNGALVGNLSPDESAAYRRSFQRWEARQTVGQAAVCGVPSTGSDNPLDFPTPLVDDLIVDP